MSRRCLRWTWTPLAAAGFATGVGWAVPAAAQHEDLPPGVGTVHTGWDHGLVAEVLTQLRHQALATGQTTLLTLLDSVRIAVPDQSLADGSPNAYALPAAIATHRWILVEARFMDQITGFADLGALFALLAYGEPLFSFAHNTFDDFCRRFQQSYREATTRGAPAPTYEFRLEPYLSRTDPANAADNMLLDKLASVVGLNTIVWSVLHEVGHHALGHAAIKRPTSEVSRQREVAADSFAFQRMQQLGYSHFGVGSYMVARAMTEVCLADLDLIEPEAQSTHPSWITRDVHLRSTFDVTTAPWQEMHMVHLPVPGDRPLLTTLVFFNAQSPNRDVTIVQNDRLQAGLVEWQDTTATIYVRGAGGGRLELILPNATRIPQMLVERSFDVNGKFIRSVKLPTIQVDATALDFLVVGGQTFGSIRTSNPDSLFVAHLRKAGGTPGEIVAVLAARNRYQDARYAATGAFLKGRTQSSAFTEGVQQASRAYEAEFIDILGRPRYQAFVTSYSAVATRMPPLTGINAWEDQLLQQNFSR